MLLPQQAIDILLDRTMDISVRDDVAMDAGRFDNSEVEAALLAVASDPSESDIVAASAGESLGEIWLRKGGAPRAILDLREDARAEALAVLAQLGT